MLWVSSFIHLCIHLFILYSVFCIHLFGIFHKHAEFKSYLYMYVDIEFKGNDHDELIRYKSDQFRYFKSETSEKNESDFICLRTRRNHFYVIF